MVRRDTLSSDAAWSIDTLRPNLGSSWLSGISMGTLVPPVWPEHWQEQCHYLLRREAHE
jgi:hypothetical protein